MEVRSVIEKLKTPVFWVMLVSIVSTELAPVLEAGGEINVLAVVKLVAVAFAGLVATPPKALAGAKKDEPSA
jgi:hypothetical protein